MRAALAAVVIALIAAGSATAAPPRAGLFVPGKSLGGVRLGMTPGQVKALWGADHGVCRGCLDETWFFTYRRFRPEGAGIVLLNGRVAAIFTHWSPNGWHTANGVRIGDPSSSVTRRFRTLPPTTCATYSVITAVGPNLVNAYYVVNGRVWGFGLQTTLVNPCVVG
jgi:hypothetical protein